MKKILDDEEVVNAVVAIGDNLSKIESIAKSIDFSLEDEINFKRKDIENLISVLIDLINSAKEDCEKAEELIGL